MTRPPERSFFALFVRFWLPLLVYVSAIFVASAQSHLHAPLEFRFGDKLLHVAEYLILGLLLARALRAHLRLGHPVFAAVAALGFVVLTGAADEYLQSFIPGRQCSLLDLVADTVGGAVAQIAYVWSVRS